MRLDLAAASRQLTGKVLGPAEPVTIPSSYIQQMSFLATAGRMAYVRVDKKANIKQIAFDPKTAKTAGVAHWVIQGSSLATQPDVSGDGRRLVFSSLGEKNEDLFVLPLTQSAASEKISLTGDIYKDRMPKWSTDGEQVAFYSDRSGNYEIWFINKDASDLKQLTHVATDTEYGMSDNRRLLFSFQGKLQIVDSLTKRVATIMEIAPDGFFGFALPKDERLIYFTQGSTEIDIWLSEIQ